MARRRALQKHRTLDPGRTSAKLRAAWTPERRARARERMLDKRDEYKARNVGNKYGAGNVNRRGAKFSEESKLKMSVSASKRWRKTKRRGTKIELSVQAMLERSGLEFKAQYTPSDIGRFVFDFAIPSKRVLIEVDGCFWHGCKRCGHPGLLSNRANDAKKSWFAKHHGWRLIRVKGCRVTV